MNVDAKIAVIETKIESLEDCYKKMDKLRNGDSTQNQALIELKNQIISLEAGMDRHLKWHDKSDGKRWQLLLLVLGPIISLAVGFFLAKSM